MPSSDSNRVDILVSEEGLKPSLEPLYRLPLSVRKPLIFKKQSKLWATLTYLVRVEGLAFIWWASSDSNRDDITSLVSKTSLATITADALNLFVFFHEGKIMF